MPLRLMDSSNGKVLLFVIEKDHLISIHTSVHTDLFWNMYFTLCELNIGMKNKQLKEPWLNKYNTQMSSIEQHI